MIRSQFCSCPDSLTVVTCAKWCPDWIMSMFLTQQSWTHKMLLNRYLGVVTININIWMFITITTWSQDSLYHGNQHTWKYVLHIEIGHWFPVRHLTTLTHWGRVTHICDSKLTIMSTDRPQAIIWNIVNWALRNKLQWKFNHSGKYVAK